MGSHRCRYVLINRIRELKALTCIQKSEAPESGCSIFENIQALSGPPVSLPVSVPRRGGCNCSYAAARFPRCADVGAWFGANGSIHWYRPIREDQKTDHHCRIDGLRDQHWIRVNGRDFESQSRSVFEHRIELHSIRDAA